MCTTTTKTYTNKKTNEEVQSTLTHEEALRILTDKTDLIESGWLGFWLHKLANEAKATKVSAKKGFMAIKEMFDTAIKNGRKRPEISVVFADVKFRLYYPRSGSGNVCVKVAVRKETVDGKMVFGPAEFICSINKETGALWQPTNSDGTKRGFEYVEQVFFRLLEADPVRFLAECGKGLGWCCYCGKRLEQDGSIYHGYGQTCAKRWNLPWGKAPADWKESTIKDGSEAANRKLHHLIPDVFKRDDWYEAEDYLIASDYHEEHGNMDKARELRNYVIKHPFAWSKVA